MRLRRVRCGAETGGDARFAHLGAVHVSLLASKRHAALDFPSLFWGYIPRHMIARPFESRPCEQFRKSSCAAARTRDSITQTFPFQPDAVPLDAGLRAVWGVDPYFS